MMRRLRTALVVGILLLGTGFAAAPAPPPLCTASEYRQFDFFVGDWDVYDVGRPDSIVARNRVAPMLGGCALREVYQQGDGLRGESFSLYDATRRVWHQSWVTNRGELLLLEGQLAGDRMVLLAPETGPNGSSSLVRGTWWQEGAAVRLRAERSHDAGRSWTMLYDIVFRPHGSKS